MLKEYLIQAVFKHFVDEEIYILKYWSLGYIASGSYPILECHSIKKKIQAGRLKECINYIKPYVFLLLRN